MKEERIEVRNEGEEEINKETTRIELNQEKRNTQKHKKEKRRKGRNKRSRK